MFITLIRATIKTEQCKQIRGVVSYFVAPNRESKNRFGLILIAVFVQKNEPYNYYVAFKFKHIYDLTFA